MHCQEGAKGLSQGPLLQESCRSMCAYPGRQRSPARLFKEHATQSTIPGEAGWWQSPNVLSLVLLYSSHVVELQLGVGEGQHAARVWTVDTALIDRCETLLKDFVCSFETLHPRCRLPIIFHFVSHLGVTMWW